MSFAFEKLGGKHRALLFVNGWQFGKFVGNVGGCICSVFLPFLYSFPLTSLRCFFLLLLRSSSEPSLTPSRTSLLFSDASLYLSLLKLVFPVPEGILNYHGTNTVALSFWAYGTESIDLNLGVLKHVVKGGVGHALSQNPGWFPRT